MVSVVRTYSVKHPEGPHKPLSRAQFAASMEFDDAFTLSPNYLGTGLFLSYILSALYLTSTISLSLYQRYAINSTCLPSKAKRQVLIFSLLALVSFATLSYHMLSFLISSFEEWSWSTNHNVPPIPDSFSDIRNLWREWLQILWQWMIESELFSSFAADLVSDDNVWRWTHTSLIATLFWNLWIAASATRHHIPVRSIWHYIALGQILPISFTSTLWFIRLLLIPASEKESLPKLEQKRTFTYLIPTDLLVVVFVVLLNLFRQKRDSDYFIPLLLFTRLFLLLPYYWDYVEGWERRGLGMTVAMMSSYVVSNMWASHGWDVWDVLMAVNDNWAIEALGWDWLLGVVVAVVWLSREKL